MSAVTAQPIRPAAKGVVNAANMNSVLTAMNRYGSMLGLDRAHRAVQLCPDHARERRLPLLS
jgi:putative chitinase